MTVVVGNFSLSLAVLVGMLAVLVSMAAGRFQSSTMLRAARWLVAALFGLLTLSSAALVAGLLGSDFQIEYVAHYTERALPFGYKLAAFWAGQEGSLLLWAWLLAGMSTVAVFTIAAARKPTLVGKAESFVEPAAIVASLAVVCGFFAALMLFAANPFKLIDVIPSDGHGLNPMLQDPGMIAHPPLLFLGYAGYTIPFALLIGALAAGRKDNEWIIATRRWSLISWLFLSIGILLGAQWAYVELGWGGYWAWDPVENASLLPWLTGTALLHSIMVQQHRGMFKKWNAALIAVTFLLCIFGTYLTRSGVIQSVHSFGESLIGTFFLVFLAIVSLFSVIFLVVRRRLLKSEQELEGLMGKEGFFLATNVLLVGMTLITLIGTIFPIITNVLAGQQVAVAQSFYNKVVAPLGLLLVALMAVGPLLVYGKEALERLIRGLIFPGIAAGVVLIAAIAMGLWKMWLVLAAGVLAGLSGKTLFQSALASFEMRNVWMAAAASIAACALAAVLYDLIRATLLRTQTHNERLPTALIRLLDGNHRRYGGQIVHVGVLMIVVGITGSSLFEQKETFSMKQGEPVHFAGRAITLNEIRPIKEANFEAAQAVLTITDDSGAEMSLTPQIRKYDKWEQLNSEVAIRSNWREDVYVTLAAVDEHGGVSIQAIVNPLVSWIWTGGMVLTVGGIVGLLPRLLPVAAQMPAPAAVVEEDKKSRRTGGQVDFQASA